jgi:hypothetical protein
MRINFDENKFVNLVQTFLKPSQPATLLVRDLEIGVGFDEDVFCKKN